jgi:hypothetical protein
MIKPNYVEETQRLRALVLDPNCKLRWKRHAEERMKERRKTVPDIQCALGNGRVVLVETAKKDIVWRVEGRDIDGDIIVIIIAISENIINVITVF